MSEEKKDMIAEDRIIALIRSAKDPQQAMAIAIELLARGEMRTQKPRGREPAAD